MSLTDSGADIIVELSNAFALRIFSNVFRSTRICPPITISNITNPADSSQVLSAVDLVPRLKSAVLRQSVIASVPHVYVDLTLERSVGTLTINGAAATEITLPVEITVSIASGKLSISPQLGLLASFFLMSDVTIPVSLLDSTDFSAVPTATAIRLVGMQKNLAIGALRVRDSREEGQARSVR